MNDAKRQSFFGRLPIIMGITKSKRLFGVIIRGK